MTTRIGRALAVAAATLATACSPPSPPPAAAPSAVPWPLPWPERPVLGLTLDVAPDLATATGTETVVFTPDRPVCELVFRTWADKPTTARTGTSVRVTGATVEGAAVTPRVDQAGAPAGSPGTLVTLPLPSCRSAGAPVRAALAFALVAGRDAGERVGYSPTAGIAWFGSVFPLPAWARGLGWVRDPAVDLYGETATSEDFRLDRLTVTAAAGQQVLGTGAATGTHDVGGRVAHTFTADAVRDIAVSVGRMDVTNRQVGHVRVHVGVPSSGSRTSAGRWADEITDQIGRLTDLLGPFPYTDVWVTIVPSQNDGVEFPSAIQFGDTRRGALPALVAHELAHQWFYGLVGNDQATDPWLDESFATLAQAIVTGAENRYPLDDIPGGLVGDLGRPMAFWARDGNFDRYVSGVYDQGAAVLLAGRDRVGAARFDATLRAYLHQQAHRIATPADVRIAFSGLPEVVDLLRIHGAFNPKGGP